MVLASVFAESGRTLCGRDAESCLVHDSPPFWTVRRAGGSRLSAIVLLGLPTLLILSMPMGLISSTPRVLQFLELQ